MRELKYALSSQKNNKAPGHDALDALIVKNICRICLSYIRKLFILCLTIGHFPKTWKKGLVIFFRKRNTDGRSPRSFRPITLLSIFGKPLERLIKIRIMPFWRQTATGIIHSMDFEKEEARLQQFNL